MSLKSSAWRIAVTSGKGGVGKTSVTVHLARALASQGVRVGIVDADLALGNVDVLLGLTPRWHLGHVIAGERRLNDIMLDGPDGVRLAPAGSGVRSLTALDATQWTRLAGAIDEFADQVDVLLFDTATGIADTVLDVVALADCALVVTTFDPAALVDAYALVKLVDAMDGSRDIGVLVNASKRAADAETAFRQLSLVAERFLSRSLRDAGSIAHDSISAAGGGARLLNGSKNAGTRRGFDDLARRLAQWRPNAQPVAARVRPPRAAELAARMMTEVAPCA
jgi:flagellar biosynthesis protein FlhG